MTRFCPANVTLLLVPTPPVTCPATFLQCANILQPSAPPPDSRRNAQPDTFNLQLDCSIKICKLKLGRKSRKKHSVINQKYSGTKMTGPVYYSIWLFCGTLYPAYESFKAVKSKNAKNYVSRYNVLPLVDTIYNLQHSTSR